MSLAQWLTHKDPDILRAQHVAYVRQMPPMYLLVIFNIWLLSWTHYYHAPDWLVFYLPAIFTVIFVVRALTWWRLRGKSCSIEQMRRAMGQAVLLSVLLTPGIMYWASLLLEYGTEATKGHIAFVIALTAVGILVCLTQVWQAVIGVTLTVNLVFVVLFFNAGEASLTAMAVSMMSITMITTWILLEQFRDFTRRIQSGRSAEIARIEAEKLSEENIRIANEDGLTGLNNRRYFFHLLHETVSFCQQNGQRFALALLDLDGFKSINDLYGHALGDQLLRDVGQRLRDLAGEHVQVFRLSGDEFAFLIPHNVRPRLHMPNVAVSRCDAMSDTPIVGTVQEQDSVFVSFCREACTAVAPPFVVRDITLQITASIGLVVYPTMATGQESLYQSAAYALFQGKRTNRGSVTLFSHEHQARIQRDAVIEQTLRTSVLEDEMAVHFQPIVNIITGRTVAFEALARWTSSTLGPVSPGEFIPVAERTGMISTITEVLLRKALHHAAQWPQDVTLSFNLSAHDLMAPQLMQRLQDSVASSGIAPERIDLEITETAATNDTEQMQRVIRHLRAQGFGVALDDLGTGFSSLSQLLALPLTKIKIDRRFVKGIDHQPISRKLVGSLLTFSRDMGLACVLEGVETPEEHATLVSLCGKLMQGYIYSKPMPPEQTLQWLQEQPHFSQAPQQAPSALP